MRPLWRLLRVFWLLFKDTFYLSVTVRGLPPEQRDAYRAYRQQVGCARICRILGIRVTVVGELPEHGTMLAVCNHFGVLDPLVLASQMPVAFAGKAELRRWPLIGWTVRETGMIFVVRERRTMAEQFVQEVQSKMRHEVRVLVFPEGTTSKDETVLPFKTGAFAAVAGMPDGQVLPLYLRPVSINGAPVTPETRAVVTWADSSMSFVRHAWVLGSLRSVHMEIRVGEPIATAGLDRKELALRTHAQVRALGEAALVRQS